ncbi:MAG: MBOAT family protein [Cyanobacteriota bacterium]
MLFNSYEFIFIFLPITLIGFFGLAKFRLKTAALVWLTLASMAFYAYWSIAYLPLMLISAVGNYYFGHSLNRTVFGSRQAKIFLWLGIAFNLGILGYYKYADFFVNSLNQVLSTNWSLPEIILPLGISFYSFTQMAYLVDAYRGELKNTNYDFLSYLLFVIFFPQLIAGPILRHNDLILKLHKARIFIFSDKNVAVGLTFFILGLAKKVLIADSISPWVKAVFDNAGVVTFLEAWVGALSYTFQLYFDFSGYCDMAIGLGLLSNLPIPLNFDSPYKATSIIDFWRRWHITLSQFLRDYLYIPLGGSRRGEARRYFNLFVTMLLGGLWHGAGWTYIVWGGMHGLYLAINHGWRRLGHKLPMPLGWAITLLAVVASWVIFRAANLHDGVAILQAMVGMRGIVFPSEYQTALPWLSEMGLQFKELSELAYLPQNYKQSFTFLGILLLSVVLLPNTQQIAKRFKPTWWWSVFLACLAVSSLVSLSRISEFLYFQF